MPRPVRDVPWLEWRDNGVAYACWYDAGTRRTHRESLKTRDAAEAATRFGEFLLAGPGRRARGPAGLTVSEALDAYWRQHVTAVDDKGRSRVVAQQRTEIAIRHLKAYFGDRPLREVGPAESRGYLQARREGRVGGSRTTARMANGKDSTVRRELSTLVAASRHVVRWGVAPPTDGARIELPPIVDGDKVRWFTKEQLLRVIKAARDHAGENDETAAFILIAYYTAARRASIEDLLKSQVDLAAGTITLQPPGGRITKKRRPTVPIFPEIRQEVERLMRTDGPYLFSSDNSRNFYQRFLTASARAKLPDATPHMLRHSRASHMLQDGVDIWRVARLLGDTVATVERVYAHCLADHLLSESALSRTSDAPMPLPLPVRTSQDALDFLN